MKKTRNTVLTMGAMCATTPFLNTISSARIAMMSHHQNQTITPKYPDIPRILTGFESQLETFTIKMPVDGKVVSVHRRFNKGYAIDSIKTNPYTVIIFQNRVTGEYDCLEIPEFDTKHLVFGNHLKHTQIVNQLREDMVIKKDTIFAYPNSVREGNILATGISANIVNISHPSSIEDGYGVSESFCKRGTLLKLPMVTGHWGKKQYPLNIYGNDKVYKPFPDIGDTIKDCGLVMAFREYDADFDVVEMTNRCLQTVDTIHDFCIYSTPGATVYDINVLSGIGETTSKPITPKSMSVQAELYISQINIYYDAIIKSYESLINYKKLPLLNPRLINLVTRAYANRPNDPRYKNSTTGKVRRTIDKNFLDEYNVEIKMYVEQPLALGNKISGYFGDKGVTCKKINDKDMPTDELGNIADIIKFNKSPISRQNCGQLYEQHISAAARDLTTWIRNNYNILDFSIIWNKLLDFYQVASPLQYDICINYYQDLNEQHRHIELILKAGIYLTIPPDSEHLTYELIAKIDNIFKPTYGVISYTDYSGKSVTTKEKVLIGVQQFIILEKSDLKPSSVSSSILQHHGLIAGSNKSLKNSNPSNVQTTRIYSESETRFYGAIMGSDTIADLILLASSPETHKNMVKHILNSSTPTNLEPFTGFVNSSRTFSFINHVLTGFGLSIKNKQL